MAGFGYLDQNVKVVFAFGHPATPLLTKEERRKTKENIVRMTL